MCGVCVSAKSFGLFRSSNHRVPNSSFCLRRRAFRCCCSLRISSASLPWYSHELLDGQDFVDVGRLGLGGDVFKIGLDAGGFLIETAAEGSGGFFLVLFTEAGRCLHFFSFRLPPPTEGVLLDVRVVCVSRRSACPDSSCTSESCSSASSTSFSLP